MAKLFVHFTTKAAFTAATLGTEYDSNSIVFIKETQEIWTHGQFYAIPDQYKDKITNLETAVSALQAAQAANFAIKKVSDGTKTFTAAANKETLTFAAGANTSVTLDDAGKVTIGSTLGANAYYPYASGTALAGRVDTLEGDAVTNVTGSGAVTVTGTGNDRAVALKLNNTGKNVTLAQTADGLSAEVTNVDALVPVDGVAANDKVLTLNGKKIGATVSLSVDTAAGSDGKKYLRLTGANGADLGKVDIADFVKDGILSDAQYDPTSHKLTLTFNADAGKEAIEVDLASLVDVYDGSTLKLKTIVIPSGEAVEPAATDSVDSAVANLIKRDRELTSEIEGVKSNIEDLTAGGLVSIQKGTDGTFVTTTISEKADNKQSVSVAVTTNTDIVTATSANNGLATALAVKTYMEDKLTWGEY